MVTGACCGVIQSSLSLAACEIQRGRRARPQIACDPDGELLTGQSAQRTEFLPGQTALACNERAFLLAGQSSSIKGVIRVTTTLCNERGKTLSPLEKRNQAEAARQVHEQVTRVHEQVTRIAIHRSTEHIPVGRIGSAQRTAVLPHHAD
jgi:hypothetical protein